MREFLKYLSAAVRKALMQTPMLSTLISKLGSCLVPLAAVWPFPRLAGCHTPYVPSASVWGTVVSSQPEGARVRIVLQHAIWSRRYAPTYRLPVPCRTTVMVDRHTWTKYGKLLRRGELVLVRTKGTMVHTLAIQRSPPQFWLLSAEPVALSTFFAKPPTSMRYCIYLTLISKIVGVQGFD